MSKTLRFREVRELAEERVAIMLSEGEFLEDAEEAAIAWAWETHQVKLKVVADAAKNLPLTELSGRVLWPVVYREPPVLAVEEKLDALYVAADRIAGSYRDKLTAELCKVFRRRVFDKLAEQEGIPSQQVSEYLGES